MVVVNVLNPDGTYIATPVGTQSVSGTVNAISIAPPGISNTYGISIHDQLGVVTANVFLSVFNPVGSGKLLYAIQSSVSRYSIGQNISANSLVITRISAASGGVLQPASAISKGDTTQPSSVAEVRTGNPTITILRELASYGPPVGNTSPPTSDSIEGNAVIPFILRPGEGLAYETAAGDISQRWNISQYWVEADE